MKQRLLTAVFLAAILALTALGCSGATPAVDAPQEASAKPYTADANPSEIEAVTAEQLADCLATMFPQMNRDELERQAQMQMTDASRVENAEVFVERVCGDGQTPAQAAPTGVAIAAPNPPESVTSTESESVRGLGVTRAEMEEFFQTVIAAARTQYDPVAFTLVRHAGGSKITYAQWDGWGAASRRVRYGGTYVALAGPDEDIYGILFAYEGRPRNIANEFAAVVRKVGPEDSPNRLQRAQWVDQRVRGMTFGGGGGLSNILPSNRSYRAPRSIEESCNIEGRCFVQDGIEILVTGIYGIVILRIEAVGDDVTAN